MNNLLLEIVANNCVIFEKEEVNFNDILSFLKDNEKTIQKHINKNGFINILVNEYLEINNCSDGYCSCGYNIELSDCYYFCYFNNDFYCSEKNDWKFR